MPCRIGSSQRLVRLITGALLSALGLWQVGGLLQGTVATVVGSVGMFLIVTGTLGCCPLLLVRYRFKGQQSR